MGKMTLTKICLCLQGLFIFCALFFYSPVANAALVFEPKYMEAEYCKVPAGFMSAAKGDKWWKPAYDAITNAVVAVGEGTFKAVAPGAQTFLGVCFALWLAVAMLKVVGSMKEQDPGEVITRVGGMFFKGVFAVALLNNSSQFFEYFVAPITSVGAGFAGLDGGGGTGLAAVISPLSALMDTMHDSITQMIGIGHATKCYALLFDFKVIGINVLVRFPNLSLWMNGCLVVVGGWILMIAFPFRIFDACLRLGVSAALCPLFIVSWVFPMTAGLAKKGFSSFLNVAFLFVCLKIILDLDVKLIMGAAGVDKLSAATSGREVLQVLSAQENGAGVFTIVACIFFAVMFLMKADELATYFSDASFSNDSAFKGAKSAVGAAKAAGGAAKLAGGAVAKGVDRSAARRVSSSRNNQAKSEATHKAWSDGGKKGAEPKKFEPSKKDKMAEYYLKKRGVIGADGADTDKMGALVQNTFRRSVASGLNKAMGGSGFKNHGADYVKQEGRTR